MNPGEIHGLHKQVVDDLKSQLAAAREDASNERTRAEAAEQELRDLSKVVNAWGAADAASDDAYEAWVDGLKGNGGMDPEPELHQKFAEARKKAALALNDIRLGFNASAAREAMEP